jgi:hypothetical protein
MVITFFTSQGLLQPKSFPECLRQCHLHHQGSGQVPGAVQEEEFSMASGQQWFHWDNATVHMAASMKDWAAKEIQLL